MRIAAAIVAVLAAGVAATAWHFRSTNTRLTRLPQVIASDIASARGLPKAPAHVVIFVEENKTYADIIGNVREAPFLNELARQGALFTASYGVAHPSQPNYLALFAGVTDTNGDRCPAAGVSSDAPNLAEELQRAHRTFVAYAEDLPQAGFRGCWAGEYARKHAPWANFSNVAPEAQQPFSAFPPYAKLPDVAFVIPNLLDDMHSASIARGDAWLREHAASLVSWAMKHDTLLVVTWDESDSEIANHIPTIFVGPMVRPGRYAVPVTHYNVLRTIEQLYGLPYAGKSAGAAPITAIWTYR